VDQHYSQTPCAMNGMRSVSGASIFDDELNCHY